MKCPKCKKDKVKKIYISGLTFETGRIVACNKCSKRPEDAGT